MHVETFVLAVAVAATTMVLVEDKVVDLELADTGTIETVPNVRAVVVDVVVVDLVTAVAVAVEVRQNGKVLCTIIKESKF